MKLNLLGPSPLLSSHSAPVLQGPDVSRPEGVTAAEALSPPESLPTQHLLPGILPHKAAQLPPAGWAHSAVTLHFSPLISASLMTSVSPSCSCKLDPRRNFKANSSICDVYETCHCLCCYRAIRCKGPLLLVTTLVFFLSGRKHTENQRLVWHPVTSLPLPNLMYIFFYGIIKKSFSFNHSSCPRFISYIIC